MTIGTKSQAPGGVENDRDDLVAETETEIATATGNATATATTITS